MAKESHPHLPPCPQCGGVAFVEERQQSGMEAFQPGPLKLVTLMVTGTVRYRHPKRACIQCGLIFTSVDPGELRKFVERHCKPEIAARYDELENRTP